MSLQVVVAFLLLSAPEAFVEFGINLLILNFDPIVRKIKAIMK